MPAIAGAGDEFADGYCLPALQANALYMDRYPLVSALSRPLIVKHLVAAARRVAIGAHISYNDRAGFGRESNGVSMADLRRQHHEIDTLNRRFDGRFRMLKGIEANIRAASKHSV